jgi:hypothetical protein
VEELKFPTFDYYLDESDPDMLVLRRQDGSLAGAFSAAGATAGATAGAAREGVVEAAEEDYRGLIRAQRDPLVGRAGGYKRGVLSSISATSENVSRARPSQNPYSTQLGEHDTRIRLHQERGSIVVICDTISGAPLYL